MHLFQIETLYELHLLQCSPLTKHQCHCDALQGRLGVEVKEQ